VTRYPLTPGAATAPGELPEQSFGQNKRQRDLAVRITQAKVDEIRGRIAQG